jgi:Yip1 domain
MDLVERVKQILLSPRTEWKVIETEPATLTELYTGYVMPLAAIGPVAQIIGGLAFSFMGFRLPIGVLLGRALLIYIASLVGTYLLALIIDWIAPSFGGRRSQIQALKVAVYSSTAFWVAGIFWLIPALWPLMILGLYSFYLLYLGLPILMKSPRDKAMGYMVVVIIASFVVYLLGNSLVSGIG